MARLGMGVLCRHWEHTSIPCSVTSPCARDSPGCPGPVPETDLDSSVAAKDELPPWGMENNWETPALGVSAAHPTHLLK